jgi:hypothetical protein
MKENNEGLNWKKIAIKRIRTILDENIKWNNMLRDEIEKQNQEKG